MNEIMHDRIAVSDYELEVRRSSGRKTVEISVERTGQLVVRAPANLSLDQIAELAERKRVWILNKLSEKQILLRSFRKREFVSGETFCFLGRPYRLRVVENLPAEVTGDMCLDEGRLLVRKSALKDGEAVFQRFCTEQAKTWLIERVRPLVLRVGVKPEKVVIRDLGFRWGSCSLNGTLNFHWRVMTLPPKMIDYIIVHELIHLVDRTHSNSFWRALRRMMPDFEARKQWIAENGAEYAG